MPTVPAIEAIQPNQVVFRIHGPKDAGDVVLADVFAKKLGTLISGLKAADRALNGVSVHQYVIARLQSTTPTVVVDELMVVRDRTPRLESGFAFGLSGIDGFENCADAVTAGDRERALKYGKCAEYIDKLGKDASKLFGYAEIWTAPQHIIRVDPFLHQRAHEIVAPKKALEIADQLGQQRWFKGTAHGSFDGTVLEVDLRGALPQLKLVLSAGGKEIDCIATNDQIEKIRQALNKRVRVFGSAIYDGRSGLPRRIQISDISHVRGDVDFTRWKEAFEPFDTISISV
jgi:hypothetical protein